MNPTSIKGVILLKRVTASAKKIKKNINIKVILIFLILGLLIGVIAIRNSMNIRNIDIIIDVSKSDNDVKEAKITKDQVISLSGLKVGDKLYKNLRSEIAEKIEKNPYVKNVQIERNFSGKLKIIVTQRMPEYLMNYSGEYIYIDKEGYILEVNKENNGKIILIGLSTDCSELSIGNSKIRLNKEDLEKLEVTNNIISALKSNDIQNKINTIDVGNKQDIILQLDEDQKTVHIGSGDDLNTRVLYMKKILETESGRSGIIYVNGDLDESYVYFKEQ